MIENGKISSLQFGILVFMFALGTAVLLLPSIVVSIAKQDAWLTALLGIGVQFCFIFLWNRLSGKYPDESVIQYSEHILGKWPGKLIGLLYVSFFIFLSSIVLADTGAFITSSVLEQTPMEFINIVFMICIVYSAYLGLEVIARSGEIFFPWLLGIFLITILLLLKDLDFSKLLPILPDGWKKPVQGIYPMLGVPFSDLVVFLLVLPFIRIKKNLTTSFHVSAMLAGSLGVFIILITLAILGVDISSRSTFAIFEVAKEIKVGQFFERVEILVGSIWIMTVFIKLSVCFYAANLATAQLFKLKSYRVTLIPYAMLVIAISLLVYPNSADLQWFASKVYPAYALVYSLLIPAILLLTAKLKKLFTKEK